MAAKTVPATQYAKRADELCRQELVKLDDLRVQQRLRQADASPGTNKEKYARAAPILVDQLRVISEFRQQVELLGWPSEHREDAEGLITKTRSAESELQRVIDAARAGDVKKTEESLQRYFGFASQSASIARDSKLNFAICGSGA